MGNEMNELMESLCKFCTVAKKEVDKIVQKGDLTPAEVDNVKKISETIMNITCSKAGMEGGMDYGYGYGMNSMTDMSGRRYNIRMDSYGNDMGYSEARGRSPVTGRYVSRGMDGMSGHSIEDRMIASLEQQMDNAKTDYERKMVEDETRHIRMGSNR